MDIGYMLLDVLLKQWDWRTVLYRTGHLCTEHGKDLAAKPGQKENAQVWEKNGQAIKDFMQRLDDTPGI